MMTAHRAVVIAPGQVALESFTPPPPQANQVLLRAQASLISPGTERAFFLKLDNAHAPFPLYPGYSFIGEVAALGADVRNLQPGQRVACPAPHASHALVEAAKCLPLPPELPADEAAFFNLAAIAMQGIRKARIELGESVAVLGAGLIGILAMRLAQLNGGLPVIGIDLNTSRLALARETAADETLLSGDSLQDDLRALLGRHTNGADVVIEATGMPQLVVTAFQLAAVRGRVVLLGSPRGDTQSVNFYRDVHRKGITVIGGHEINRPQQENSPGYWTQVREQQVCLELLARRRLKVKPLITHRYNWRDFAKAYAHLAKHDITALGILIEWT